MTDFEIALAAIERITRCADKETTISPHYSKEHENAEKDMWILSAQSNKQKELLKKHKKEAPIFVEGPNYTWYVHIILLKTQYVYKSLLGKPVTMSGQYMVKPWST